MMPQVIALRGARKIILTKFMLPSSHLAQPPDLRGFGLFKIIYGKERQSKGMKEESRKMRRALLTFYSNRIIPIVRWNFERA
jgi:hypothetical protein